MDESMADKRKQAEAAIAAAMEQEMVTQGADLGLAAEQATAFGRALLTAYKTIVRTEYNKVFHAQN